MTFEQAEPLVGREIFTFKEDGVWVACWRRFDVVTQGNSEEDAVDRLFACIAQQAIGDAELGNLTSFGSAPLVPASLLNHWKEEHAKSHGA